MWWRKKKEITTYYKKSDAVHAWQFTRENFREGAPHFIHFDEQGRVELWSQYGGNIIAGRVKFRGKEITVTENDWIVLYGQEYFVYSPSQFEGFFHTVKEKL